MKLATALLGLLLMTIRLTAEPVQGWDYQYEDHGEGTKSESISGELRYRGNELPKEFGHVITPVGEFDFASGIGFSGAEVRWTPFAGGIAETAQQVESLLSGTNPAFRKAVAGPQSTKPSDAAYIPGKFEQRPKDAGPDWFYAVKLGWWVNPRKIDEALKAIGTE